MSWPAWSLAVLVASLASATGGVVYGRAEGKAEQIAVRDAALVKDLTDIVDSHSALIGQAQAASKAMRKALTVRARHDEITTKELKDALDATASSRTGCVFDAGVMRQLAEARQRAAETAAGGIRGAVPGAAAGTVHP